MLLTAVSMASASDTETDSVTAQDLYLQIQSGEGPVIVDTRSEREYEAGHIPGAIHVPFWTAWWNADRIPDRKSVV